MMQNQKIVVIGGTSGMGLAIAKLAGRRGAKVIVGMYAAIAKNLPVGHVGTPADIAEAAVMLMTNPFITGVTLDVDGGGLLV